MLRPLANDIREGAQRARIDPTGTAMAEFLDSDNRDHEVERCFGHDDGFLLDGVHSPQKTLSGRVQPQVR